MITEDYVSLETARLLKEKEFDEPCYLGYNRNGDYIPTVNRRNSQIIQPDCCLFCCPTIQMAMKWLREKHLLHISIDMVNGGRWKYEIDDISVPFDGGVLPKYYCDKTFSSYEEGIDDAIKYCLEKLI